jgi:hypothetical protein
VLVHPSEAASRIDAPESQSVVLVGMSGRYTRSGHVARDAAKTPLCSDGYLAAPPPESRRFGGRTREGKEPERREDRRGDETAIGHSVASKEGL